MTIREIAKLAGVSPAAVSLVLNSKPGVGAQRRSDIQALLREDAEEEPLEADVVRLWEGEGRTVKNAVSYGREWET